MVVKILKEYFTLEKEYIKIAFKTAIEYKVNFIIQVIAMFLNDIVWLIFWAIIFSRFAIVGGWGLNDIFFLYAFVTIGFGLAGLLFGNHKRLAEIITYGKLDYFLTLPKNVLYHILIEKFSFYDAGDLLFGLLILFIFVPLIKIPLAILLVIPITIIFVSIGIIVGSLSFYMGNAEGIAGLVYDSLMTLSTFPITIYKGFLIKFIILFIVPAGFISGVPVELLKNFNLTWFLLLIFFTIGLLLIAIYIFYKGLKKYESGNLLYVRI